MLSRQTDYIRFIKKHGNFLAHVALLSLVMGCATKGTMVKVTEPPPVLLSKNIKKIGIINNSVVSEAGKIESRLDQLVDAENRWLSQKGTEAAVAGLFDELVKEDRFGTIKVLDSIPEPLRDFGADPEHISWPAVEALCRSYEVDVLFSLAYYDTETKVSLKKSTMLQPNMVRVKVKVPAQEITLETLIENGWRIYDPQNRQVLDEVVFNDQFISKGKGTDALRALQAVDRKDTMLLQSRSAGSQYGLRLQPLETSVPRFYYVRGSDQLVLARDLVAIDDWQGAMRLWQAETKNPDMKISSRASHNMAVASEREGALKLAIAWATKANEQFQSKNSRSYLHLLEQRVAQNDGMEVSLVNGQSGYDTP